MSEENVDRWRGGIEAAHKLAKSEADREDVLARMAEDMDPEIEWDASDIEMPDLRGLFRGKEEVLQWWRVWLGAWETIDFDCELRDAGERVVMLLDQRMRGRHSGLEVPIKYAQVATFRDGLMIHWKVYRQQSEALEATGLSE